MSNPVGFSGLTVAVTGASTVVGQRVCAQLANAAGVGQVSALGRSRPGVPGVRWRRVDATDPAVAKYLTGVDVLVHLVTADHDASREQQRHEMSVSASVALTAAAATGVPHVVLLSSARVYGAFPDNPTPLEEDSAVRARSQSGELGDLLELEGYIRRAARAYPHLGVTVLRPAFLIGPGLDQVASGLLDGPRLLMVKGSTPHWQFCHLDDLASAIEMVIRERILGAVTVGSQGWLEQAEVETILGKRRVELPSQVVLSTAARLHSLGVTADSAQDLTYLMHPWVVGSQRLRQAGWGPQYTNAEALTSYALGRPILGPRLRISAKGATAAGAAAGATVALVGTAALVRRARRRKRLG